MLDYRRSGSDLMASLLSSSGAEGCAPMVMVVRRVGGVAAGSHAVRLADVAVDRCRICPSAESPIDNEAFIPTKAGEDVGAANIGGITRHGLP